MCRMRIVLHGDFLNTKKPAQSLITVTKIKMSRDIMDINMNEHEIWAALHLVFVLLTGMADLS